MLDRELHFLLIRCFYANNRLLAQKTAAAQLDLLPGQPKILECLWEQDGATPKTIGQRCSLDKSTVTGLLSKMERQGLIARTAHSEDKRSVRIFLTDQGREKAEAIKKIGWAVDEAALAGLSPRERNILPDLLNRVLVSLEENTQ